MTRADNSYNRVYDRWTGIKDGVYDGLTGPLDRAHDKGGQGL